MTESRRIEIVEGDYLGEIICPGDDPPIYYYVLQRTGSRELLSLGQASTFAEAERFLRSAIADAVADEQRRKTAG